MISTLILLLSLTVTLSSGQGLVRYDPQIQYDYSFHALQKIEKVADIRVHAQVSFHEYIFLYTYIHFINITIDFIYDLYQNKIEIKETETSESSLSPITTPITHEV